MNVAHLPNISTILPVLDSELEYTKGRLVEVTAKLEESEASCQELEDKLALLLRKSESVLGEERLKVTRISRLPSGNEEPGFAKSFVLYASRSVVDVFCLC